MGPDLERKRKRLSVRKPESALESQKSLVVVGGWVGGIAIIESALGPDLERKRKRLVVR